MNLQLFLRGNVEINTDLAMILTVQWTSEKMTESMLDDPDATHSKPIENYFGNLDRESKKSSTQSYDKSTSNLVIKYSKDRIDASMSGALVLIEMLLRVWKQNRRNLKKNNVN